MRFEPLGARRAVALAALLTALVVYGAVAGAFADASEPWDIAFFAFVLFPATFAVQWLLLPLATAPAYHLAGAGAVLIGVAVLLRLAGADGLFNVTKLLAITMLGFAFLAFFQPPLGLLVAIAAIIPWVDAYSVWRGPTNVVVNEHPGVFDRIAIAFRAPGEDGAARLGPPDVLFFAIFLATAERFQLRTRSTFVAMVAFLGVTVLFASTFEVSGLPALPAISLGFLLPNADLLWQRFQAWRLSEARAG